MEIRCSFGIFGFENCKSRSFNVLGSYKIVRDLEILRSFRVVLSLNILPNLKVLLNGIGRVPTAENSAEIPWNK
jgi:hypothetical protein